MPVRQRKPSELVQQLMPLLLMGAALLVSNRYFTFVDDEVGTLNAASHPVRNMFAAFLSGSGTDLIPPLYGTLLHLWLHVSSGSFEYLRIPAVFFFLAGFFFLSRAAAKLAGPGDATTLIWLGILWPLGFHYGRLDEPDGFVFFLVAGLTLAYLRFIEKQDFARALTIFLFGATLLWSTFFGWAVLICLGADQLLRQRAGEPVIPARVLARTYILWMAAFIPLARPFYETFAGSVRLHQAFSARIANAALHIYNLFVSESVAPWRWQLSVPAALAVLACIVLILLSSSKVSSRFLAYSAFLLMCMAVTGIFPTQRLLILAPWVLLSMVMSIGSIKSRWGRPALAAALLMIGAIGWYGIYLRQYYSAPELLETWPQIAGNAAEKLQTGAGVISNSRPLFFYLTYALRATAVGTEQKFEGFLPDSFSQPNVFTPEQWLSSGRANLPSMIWIRGTSVQQAEPSMDAVGMELDHGCGSRESRLMMRDQGYSWKLRFLHQVAPEIWRIEIREYDCVSTNSKEIFRLPAP
jgi:hypothetical protein